MPDVQPNLTAIRARMRDMWMAGNFGAFARYSAASDDQLSGRLTVKPGERVLDIACGVGPLALRAARSGAKVTGIDIAPNLIRQARENAQAEGLQIRFDEGDAEDLPFFDSSFDLVASQFGVIYAPRPAVAMAEMARVCRPGGRVVLFHWTPDGWVGKLFQVLAAHASFLPGAPQPIRWGEESIARERLGAGFGQVQTIRGVYRIAFPFGPLEVLDFFLHNMGPVQKIYASVVDRQRHNAMRADLERFFIETNQGSNDAWQVDSEYLEIQGVRGTHPC